MNLIVKLTNTCNLACDYCSVGNPDVAKHLDKAVFKEAVDTLPELLDDLKQNDISFIWHGGEPMLMGREYLADIMEYCQVKLVNYTLSFKIQTNGVLIDAEWIELFKKFDVSVGISLDGYQEIHDNSRKTKDGLPTFYNIMENITALRNADIEPGILMVLNTAKSINVEQLWQVIAENSFHCKIHTVYPSGRAENRKDIDSIYYNYLVIMKQLYEKLMQSDEEVNIDPLNSLTEAILREEEFLGECSFAGTCGTNFLCIFEDGGVSFCGRHANDFGINYGNIQDKSLLELYHAKAASIIRGRSIILENGECKGCSYYKLCHGGCSFEALLNTGNLGSKYRHCEGWKELIDFIQSTGLSLLKARLLRDKRKCSEQININKSLLEVLTANDEI